MTDPGRIIVSSASDAGDDTPFDSAVSDAGRVTVSAAGRVRVALAPHPTVLGTFPGYKAEAVECPPGTSDALLGTDDENLGGHVRAMPFCGAWHLVAVRRPPPAQVRGGLIRGLRDVTIAGPQDPVRGAGTGTAVLGRRGS
ncbi:hypothetical protein [Streptomyces sp. NPDC088139]|uniref:hypothetical protein n=2 Tax=unclassified Streptomyces TaxID=2593676 RepID=UPI0038131755